MLLYLLYSSVHTQTFDNYCAFKGGFDQQLIERVIILTKGDVLGRTLIAFNHHGHPKNFFFLKNCKKYIGQETSIGQYFI